MSTYKSLCLNAIYIYLFWNMAHYICPHIYVHLCVPATFNGFLLSPFIAPAPHCQSLRWLIYQGGNNIVAMWLLLGTWCMQVLIMQDKDNKTE